MAVPTWRSQAAPSFEAPLRTVGQANKALVEGLGKISKGIEDTSDEYGDIVKNEAYNTLSNIMPEPGESRAAARQRAIAENPGAFDSSFLGSKEMDNLEKTLGALDAGKKQVDDRNWTMGKVRELEGIDPLENPDQARALMTEIYKEGKLTNRSDPDKQLESYSAALLRSTDYKLTDDVITRSGGIIGDESTFTTDVVTKVRKDIADHVRKNNLHAPEKQVQSTVDRILRESPYGRAFTRGIKRDEAMSFKDKVARNAANSIMDARTDEEKREAINNASRIIKRNPNWSQEDAAFMTQPIIDALDDMNIDALEVWEILKLGTDGNLKDQRIFLDKMYELYRHHFTELPKKVIDQKIRNDIQKSGTLNTMIKAGNKIAELKADDFESGLEQYNKKRQEIREFFLDERPVYSKAGDALLENLKKKFGGTEEWKELEAKGVGELYRQVRMTSDKLKKAFIYPQGHPRAGESSLKPWHQDTFDLAIFRMLSNVGGYDPNRGFLNFKDPDFTIMSIDPTSEMAKVDVNVLMDELQRWLPKARDRTPEARKALAKDKAAGFDKLVNQFVQKHPPLHKIEMGRPGDNASWEDRKAWFRQILQSGKISWDTFRALGVTHFGWGDPDGSVGEKMNRKVGGWMLQMWKEFQEFQEIGDLGLPPVQSQNKYNPN